MNESFVRQIGCFFFFSLLDERMATEASLKALAFAKIRLKKSPHFSLNSLVVIATYEIWHRISHKLIKGSHHLTLESGWVVPDGIDLAPWKEFQKTAPEEELLSVIWGHILKIPSNDISLALGLTAGTVRYRTGQGLKRLGDLARPGASPVRGSK